MTVLGPRPTRALTAAVAAALLAATAARDAGAQRRTFRGDPSRVDTTIAIAKNGSVTINGGSGDIIVTGWSRDVVRVLAERDAGGVRLSASSSRSSLEIGAARGGDTRFEVSVPYGVRVLARTHSGDVSVRGTRGAADIHTQSGGVHVQDVTNRLAVTSFSGDIAAEGVSGDVVVTTISGEVSLTDLVGDADIGTVSGSIDLRGATSKVVHAKTTSGDVIYDGLIDPAGRYELSAHSGDIRIRMQRDASARVSISTWSGSIDSDFTMTLPPGEHGIGSSKAKAFTFSIGRGAARITADTFNGDITISANDRATGARRP